MMRQSVPKCGMLTQLPRDGRRKRVGVRERAHQVRSVEASHVRIGFHGIGWGNFFLHAVISLTFPGVLA